MPSMNCPHCTTSIHESWRALSSREAKDSLFYWGIHEMNCPECNRVIIKLYWRKHNSNSILASKIVYPKKSKRTAPQEDVNGDISEDYEEACLVLNDSVKASAALSRRCLQNILREKAELQVLNTETGLVETKKVKPGNLADEIQQVLNHGGLPTQIANGLDAVRQIGNFAAHPIKSKSTGEIVTVEVGEAELNLHIIESLFDYYFVQPKKLRDKVNELNKKLQDAGKPLLKQVLT